MYMKNICSNNCFKARRHFPNIHGLSISRIDRVKVTSMKHKGAWLNWYTIVTQVVRW